MTTNRRTLLVTLAFLGLAAPPARAGEVTGRVLTADGQPAVGAVVATHWQFDAGAPKIHTFQSATTDANGRFSLETEFHFGRTQAVTALSIDEESGGILAVTPAEAKQGPIEIKLAPLVRVRGVVESASPKYPVEVATALVLLPDRVTCVATAYSFDTSGKYPERGGPARYDLRLPPGDYVFSYLEPTQPTNHTGAAQWVKVRGDVPGLIKELKPVQLPLAPFAAQREAGPPPLHIKAARGVGQDVKLADYKGKWVVLEFWSVNCGPCLVSGLPELMDFRDDHDEARDEFAVLTVHGQGADDLADLDRQLGPTARDAWGGRALPFPILLDDDGQTFSAFEIESIPTTVVIRPDGKVAEGGMDELLAALPEVPIPVQVARALDRPIRGAVVAGAGEGLTLGGVLESLGMGHEFAITTDPAALRSAGVTAETRVPLTLVGPVTLRSALRLVLEPLGLAAVPGPEGLVVTTPPAAAPPAPTAAWGDFQAHAADRLRRRLAEPMSLDQEAKPLADVLDRIAREVREPIVLDPAARRAGTIDPKAPVTVAAEGVPLGDVLRTILAPLGLEAAIRDEMILIRKSR